MAPRGLAWLELSRSQVSAQKQGANLGHPAELRRETSLARAMPPDNRKTTVVALQDTKTPSFDDNSHAHPGMDAALEVMHAF